MRALAGEGGEVGGKALALLESWKQLVTKHHINCHHHHQHVVVTHRHILYRHI